MESAITRVETHREMQEPVPPPYQRLKAALGTWGRNPLKSAWTWPEGPVPVLFQLTRDLNNPLCLLKFLLWRFAALCEMCIFNKINLNSLLLCVNMIGMVTKKISGLIIHTFVNEKQKLPVMGRIHNGPIFLNPVG